MSAVAMNYPKYESYKDSGVDWLGEIPSDWQSKKLGVLLTEFSKKNNPNMPLLSITRELGVITRDMDDQESNHNFIPDDLSGYKLLKKGQFGMNKMKAWQGSYGISNYTGIVSPAYYVFDVSNEIYPNFFNIAIRSKFYVDFFGSASDGVRIGQWDLNKTRMREIPFIFPSVEQQKKIYEFLSKKIKQIDQVIALKQQQLDKLNEYKQIVIQNAVTKGLDPNAPMKDSGVEWIGEIPDHWEVKKLKFIFDNIQTGTTPTSQNESYFDGEINWFTPKDLNNDWLLNSERKLDQLAITHKQVKLFEKNSVLVVGIGATSGKTSFMPIEGAFNQQITAFKSYYDNNKFYYYLIQSLSSIMLSLANYTTLPILNNEFFKKLILVQPPLAEQDRIAEYLDEQMQKFNQAKIAYQTQIDRLKEYKNVLINQAVTGKIKIDS